MRRTALGVLAAVAIAGWAGTEAGATRAPPPARPPRRPAAARRRPAARDVRFRTRDGVTLAGAVVGSGPVGRGADPRVPADRCGWWPYAALPVPPRRAGAAVRPALLRDSACPDGRGHATDDVAAAMRRAAPPRRQRVALVGASMGGAIAVVAAARLHPAAVVDLSGEPTRPALTPGHPTRTPAPPRPG